MEFIEEQKAKDYELKFENQIILEREKILLNQYAKYSSIVYIIKVKTFENGEYIIKIGESRRGIKERYNEHKANFEECLLLDCFAIDKSKDFEKFLHNYDNIKSSKFSNLQGHEKEMELFLIGQNLTYKKLLDIISKNINSFNIHDTSKLELENEKLKLLIQLKNDENENVLIHELMKTVKQLCEKIDKQEKHFEEKFQIILQKLNAKETNTITGFNQQLRSKNLYKV
jgi:arsenate reductase-like glutaredoxin family protein